MPWIGSTTLYYCTAKKLQLPELAVTIEHVEERGQPRLPQTIPGEQEFTNRSKVRKYSPPRWQQSSQTGVSDAAIREVPRGDLHEMRRRPRAQEKPKQIIRGQTTLHEQGRRCLAQALAVLQRGSILERS